MMCGSGFRIPLKGTLSVLCTLCLLIRGLRKLRQEVDLIWHKQVPLKVSILAWRLLRDRLPTKSNLAMRGVFDAEACQCVSGCGFMEDANHLFLLCPCFGSLWPLLRRWIGFDDIDHCDISSHFV